MSILLEELTLAVGNGFKEGLLDRILLGLLPDVGKLEACKLGSLTCLIMLMVDL